MKIVSYLINNKPIRKVVVAGLAAGLVFLGRSLGVQIGSEEATNAISGLIPILAAYVVPDPRVG